MINEKHNLKATVFWGALLVALVWTANLLTANFGMIPTGFGFITTAGTYCAGLTFVVRDLVHEYGGGKAALIAITIGAVVTALTTSPVLAFASGFTFLLAEVIDLGIYSRLRKKGYIAALVGSSIVAAAVDSVLFLWLAGFPISLDAVAGQMLVKGYAILALSLAVGVRILAGRRALPS